MIIIAHILLGALIGKALNNLFLAIVLAFISHFILDALPHWDVGSFKRRNEFDKRDWLIVFADLVIGAVLTIYFAIIFESWSIVAVAFFSILPDLIDNGSWLFNIHKKPFFKQFNELHEALSFEITEEMLWLGVLVELAVIAAVFAVIFFV